MIKIVLLLAIALLGSSCKEAAISPPNMAVEAVRAIDPDITCVAVFTGAGVDVVHSARCKLSDKSIAYCRLTVASRKLECGPLFDAPPPPKTEPAAPSTAPLAPEKPPAPKGTP